MSEIEDLKDRMSALELQVTHLTGTTIYAWLMLSSLIEATTDRKKYDEWLASMSSRIDDLMEVDEPSISEPIE